MRAIVGILIVSFCRLMWRCCCVCVVCGLIVCRCARFGGVSDGKMTYDLGIGCYCIIFAKSKM